MSNNYQYWSLSDNISECLYKITLLNSQVTSLQNTVTSLNSQISSLQKYC